MYRILVLLIAFMAGLPALGQGPAEGGPPFRRDGDDHLESGPFFPFINNSVYNYGVEQSKKGKLFVVIVSPYRRGWAGPTMFDLWHDPRVVSALQKSGAVAASYFDEPWFTAPNEPSATLGRFARMPRGLYAIRNGEVADHVAEPVGVDQLLEWLDLVLNGGPSLEVARKQAGERVDGGPLLPRLVLATRLDLAGEKADAGAEYEWVLEQIMLHDVREQDWNDPKSVDRTLARSYPFLQRGAEFAKQNEAAMTRICALRDSMAEKTETATDEQGRLRARSNWFRLYEIAPNPDQLIAWFKKQPPETQNGRSHPRLTLRRQVFQMLIAGGRWADAGSLVDKPISWATDAFVGIAATKRLTGGGGTPQKDDLLMQARVRVAAEAGETYAALLAAGREDDAQAVAAALQEFDKGDQGQTVRKGLILMAIEANQARPFHLQWAEEVDKTQPADMKLKPKVEEALRQKAGR